LLFAALLAGLIRPTPQVPHLYSQQNLAKPKAVSVEKKDSTGGDTTTPEPVVEPVAPVLEGKDAWLMRKCNSIIRLRICRLHYQP
jgi:hypothetical protein